MDEEKKQNIFKRILAFILSLFGIRKEKEKADVERKKPGILEFFGKKKEKVVVKKFEEKPYKKSSKKLALEAGRILGRIFGKKKPEEKHIEIIEHKPLPTPKKKEVAKPKIKEKVTKTKTFVEKSQSMLKEAEELGYTGITHKQAKKSVIVKKKVVGGQQVDLGMVVGQESFGGGITIQVPKELAGKVVETPVAAVEKMPKVKPKKKIKAKARKLEVKKIKPKAKHIKKIKKLKKAKVKVKKPEAFTEKPVQIKAGKIIIGGEYDQQKIKEELSLKADMLSSALKNVMMGKEGTRERGIERGKGAGEGIARERKVGEKSKGARPRKVTKQDAAKAPSGKEKKDYQEFEKIEKPVMEEKVEETAEYAEPETEFDITKAMGRMGRKEKMKAVLKEIKGKSIVTNYDKIVLFVKSMEKVKLNEISEELDIDKDQVLSYLDPLEQNGLIEIHYPAIGQPTIVYLAKKGEKKETEEKEVKTKQEKPKKVPKKPSKSISEKILGKGKKGK